jgi:hypothetical protein
MNRAAAVIAIALSMSACASLAPDPDAVHAADALEIAPYALHESCMKLAAGDRVDWRFESREPVDFNLHYHEGPMVLMPVVRNASYGDSGIFPVTIPQDYCAMWEAGPAGAIVTYRVRPIRGAR